MILSNQSNPLSSGSSYWWLNSGLPFMSSSLGSNGSWDGSRWVQEQSSTPQYSIYEGTSNSSQAPSVSGMSSSSISGVNGFGLSTPGFGGAFNDESLAGIGQQGALSGMANSAMSSLGNAALSGTISGALSNSISTGISSAVAGLASPASIAGVLGGALNGALGLSTSPTVGAIAGLASMVSPALGLAVGVFGPTVADIVSDITNTRDFEHTKDFAEDLSNSFTGGRIAGKTMSNALAKDMNLSTTSKMGTVTDVLGQLGISNMGLAQEALTAAYQDLGFADDVASISAMADIVGSNISDVTSGFGVGFGSQQAGPSSFGNTIGSFNIGSYMDDTLSDIYGQLSLDTLSEPVSNKGPGTVTQGPATVSASIDKGVVDTTSQVDKSSQETSQSTPSSTTDKDTSVDNSSTTDTSNDTSSGGGGDPSGSTDSGQSGNDSTSESNSSSESDTDSDPD